VLQYRQAIPPREHPVQNQQVERGFLEAREGVVTRDGRADLPVLQSQALRDGITGLLFVLDDQDMGSDGYGHGAIVRGRCG
jgi:hypothetical protein